MGNNNFVCDSCGARFKEFPEFHKCEDGAYIEEL